MVDRRWPGVSKELLAGLAIGMALFWVLSGRNSPPALAQGLGSGEASGTIAFTSGGAGSPQLLYLVDTKSQALAVYRVDPQNAKGTLKLEAARQYRWDLKLAEYNNQAPDVSSIESMVGSPRK